MPNIRELFIRHVGQTSTFPLGLEIDRAEGVHIYDTEGKQYYDMNSGISVSSLGHRHPAVTEAVKNQVDKFLHTMVYGEHIQSPQVGFAEMLTSTLDDSLNAVYYLLSGSEAIELAMKLAKRVTGRYEIVACRNAYHGSTQGAESLRSDHDYSAAFAPLIPGIRHIDFNSQEDLEYISEKTAGVILEAVQAEAGVRLPQNDYLNAVREKCRETGALMILDEIQTGFGRTGHLFAHQRFGVLPDVLCLGKAMGGGMPISAVVSSRNILGVLTKNPDLGHITTFGGHPVSCAAALATLQTLLKDDIIKSVDEKENYIREKLTHPIVREIRSCGLMMAVQLTKRKYLKHVVTKAIDNGVLIDYFLFDKRAFRLAPPLIYSKEELEEACLRMTDALDYAQSLY